MAFLLCVGQGAAQELNGQFSTEDTIQLIQQRGGHWAGPDLRGKSRSRATGDIVGAPPSSGVGPAASGPSSSPAPGVPSSPSGVAPTVPVVPGAVPGSPESNNGEGPSGNPLSSVPSAVSPSTGLQPGSSNPSPALPPRRVSGADQIQPLINNGSLVPLWIGQGRVAGEMLDLALRNTTEQPISVELEPGMVLELEDPELSSAFQPIMLESQKTILVPPGGESRMSLRGYCLDYSLAPPSAGKPFPYSFASNTDQFQPARNVLDASLNYDAEQNLLPAEYQRTVVIQRGIWAALGQTNEDKLYDDILSDAASSGKSISKKKARRLARDIWNEVERLMALSK